jgi:hypothetical protein
MGVADRQKLIADAGKKESWRKEEVKVCAQHNYLSYRSVITNISMQCKHTQPTILCKLHLVSSLIMKRHRGAYIGHKF